MPNPSLFANTFVLADHFLPEADAVLYPGYCLDLLEQIPDRSMQLIVTSPPYNIGKEYEKKQQLQDYITTVARLYTVSRAGDPRMCARTL